MRIKARPLVWVLASAFVFLTAYGGWYFVGALEMGAADGPGSAPGWLEALRSTVIVLLLPLGWIALRIEPSIGYVNVDAMLLFAVIVAINSALLVAIAYGIGVGARRWHRRDSTR